MTLSRRRFISISAAASVLAGRSEAASLHRWQGTALGARASITLRHPDAVRITAAARLEIDRLEDVFSLYRGGSALSRLNAVGHLDNPPFELLDCLRLAGAAHHTTNGLFDPTVQPLWNLHARSHAAGRKPSAAEVQRTRESCGWVRVFNDATFVRLGKGMGLTLNGIAQGYIADRVADLFRAEGLTDVMIDTGELRALGGNPQGGAWQVTLDSPSRPVIGLQDRALASSSALGTVLDGHGQVGHIIDPRTGWPVPPLWNLVSVSAETAAVADALSTAMCLMTRPQITDTLAGLTGVAVTLS